MARARGANAQLLFAYESTYGQDPGGNYRPLPLVSTDLAAEQGLVEDDLLGQGRDPSDPSYDLVRIAGREVVVPLDVRNLGFWLSLFFGDPATTGTGPYTHTWTSGGTPRSAALEIGHPEVPAFFLFLGVKADSLRFELGRSGTARVSVGLVAQDEQRNPASQGGTPAAPLTLSRFRQSQGNVQRNGSDLGNLLSATAEIRNNLEAVETLRPDQLVEGYDETVGAFTGQIQARFASTLLYQDAVDGTPLDLRFLYIQDAAHQLTVRGRRVFLPREPRSISGPGGVEFSASFQGARDDGVGYMVELELVNDVDAYDNPA